MCLAATEAATKHPATRSRGKSTQESLAEAKLCALLGDKTYVLRTMVVNARKFWSPWVLL